MSIDPASAPGISLSELAAGDPRLAAVERMFAAMYRQMQSMGLAVPLAEGGEALWMRAMAPSFGKTSVLLLAAREQLPVGFGHGMIRLAAGHLVPSKTGFISHVYVDPAARGQRVGKQLVEALEAWLAARGVASIELHVIDRNAAARAFWTACGYAPDLVQMRRQLAPGPGAPDRQERS